MNTLGVIVILLVACLAVAAMCLGLVIYMFIKLRRAGWKKTKGEDTDVNPK